MTELCPEFLETERNRCASIHNPLVGGSNPPGATNNPLKPQQFPNPYVIQFSLEEDQRVTGEEIEGQFFDTTRPSSLLKRFIRAEEVAHLVVYVCSPPGRQRRTGRR